MVEVSRRLAHCFSEYSGKEGPLPKNKDGNKDVKGDVLW